MMKKDSWLVASHVKKLAEAEPGNFSRNHHRLCPSFSVSGLHGFFSPPAPTNPQSHYAQRGREGAGGPEVAVTHAKHCAGVARR